MPYPKCKDSNEGKLRTYAHFKTQFQKEKYLSVIKDIGIRKWFMSFRISSHKLEVKQGSSLQKTDFANYVTQRMLKMRDILYLIAVTIKHYVDFLRRFTNSAKSFKCPTYLVNE